jgi:molybdopterin synthase catalytic subunit
MMIRVQTQDFSVEAVLDELRQRAGDCGAMVSFVGLVRELGQAASIQSMTLEHYPGMTEKALTEIAEKAGQRWSLNAMTIIHRVGTLEAGDQIVIVATASQHRRDAFEAAEFIMDYLKTDAPFWKKEHTSEGDRWVEQRHSDVTSNERWQKSE